MQTCQDGEKFIENNGVKVCASDCGSLYQSKYEAIGSVPKCVSVCKNGDALAYVENGICTDTCSTGFYTIVSSDGVENKVC